MDQPQNKLEGYYLVELFGHSKEFGFLTTEYFGAACMFRVDVPGLEEREWVLEKPEYGQHTGYQELPIGTKVKRGAVAPRSRLLGVGAIYGMTPCTQEAVMLAIERSIARPLIVLSLPEGKQLTAARETGLDYCDECGEESEQCRCE